MPHDRFSHKKFLVFFPSLLLGLVFCAYGEKVKTVFPDKNAPSFAYVQSSKSIQQTPKTIVTPNLIGKTKNEAKTALIKIGLKLGVVNITPSGKGKPGTVVQQRPAAKKVVSPGSAVDLWILGGPASPTKPAPKTATPKQPKINPRQKFLFLEFPEDVINVVLFDAKGAPLQRFASGRDFDITESLVKTKAGRIFVEFERKTGQGVPKAVPRMGARPDRAIFDLGRYRNLASASFTIEDDTTIERHEPANDTITGAPLLSAGYYSGEVGGGDATDYCKVTSNRSGFGTLIQIEVKSGSVSLGLYDPTRVYLDADNRKVWIALRPDTTFYFQVSPTGSTAGAYRLSISKKTLNDAYEANDAFSQAKTFGAGRAFLANVIDNTGHHVGIKDFYKFRVPEPQNLRLEVSGAGLASGDQVTLSLYDANGEHVTTSTGHAAGCTLAYDLRPVWSGSTWPPFPAGDWRIEVATPTAGAGSPKAYGTGDPPVCYTQAAGYTLTVDVLP